MENMYDVQNFYKSVMGEYSSDGLWAVQVVNSVRDSLSGDSTYLGTQSITLRSKTFSVNVPKGYDIEFDTTFGFPMMRRDTISDTIANRYVFRRPFTK